MQIRSELEGQDLYNNNIINKRALGLRTAAGADVCVFKAAYTLEKALERLTDMNVQKLSVLDFLGQPF